MKTIQSKVLSLVLCFALLIPLIAQTMAASGEAGKVTWYTDGAAAASRQFTFDVKYAAIGATVKNDARLQPILEAEVKNYIPETTYDVADYANPAAAYAAMQAKWQIADEHGVLSGIEIPELEATPPQGSTSTIDFYKATLKMTSLQTGAFPADEIKVEGDVAASLVYLLEYELTKTTPPTSEELTANPDAQPKIEAITGSIAFTEDVTFHYVPLKARELDFIEQLPSVSATAQQNANQNTMLAYANSDLRYSGTDDAFLAAMGEAIYTLEVNYKWGDSLTPYKGAGDVTYHFNTAAKKEYVHDETLAVIAKDYMLTRTIEVRAVTKDAPKVSINYVDNTLKGVDSSVSYSLDGVTWTPCKENMEIPSSMYNKTVYFYYPATDYYDASRQSLLYVPPKAETPKATLNLTATSYSITIINCWDYENCEFRIEGGDIDGITWYKTQSDTYTFFNLKPDTSYKVHVRKEPIPGTNLASDSATVTKTTEPRPEPGITLEYRATDKEGYINAIAVPATEITGRLLSGTFTTQHLSRFDNVVTTYADRYDAVYTDMKIYQYEEGTDIREYRLYMPMESLRNAIRDTTFDLSYTNNIMSITFPKAALQYYTSKKPAGTLRIEVEKINSAPGSAKFTWVKNHYDDGRPVYYINVGNDGFSDTELKYSIPYYLTAGETISGLEVYAVDSSGKRFLMEATYNIDTKSLEFATDLTGYIVIVQTNESDPMPFDDVSKYHWGYSFIEYGYNRGLFSGTSASRFSPDINITRGMIFTLLAKMDGYDVNTAPKSSKFEDVEEDAWYAAAAEWALEEKLVSGSEFNANRAMTRVEVAEVIYNYVTRWDKYDGEGTTVATERFIDCGNLSATGETAIAYMVDLGLMKGYSPKMFHPEDTVTRAQMAVILSKLDEIKE